MLRTCAERNACLKRVPNVEASGGRTVSPAGCLNAMQFVQFFFYLDTWKDACGRCSRLPQQNVWRPSACSKLAHRHPQLLGHVGRMSSGGRGVGGTLSTPNDAMGTGFEALVFAQLAIIFDRLRPSVQHPKKLSRIKSIVECCRGWLLYGSPSMPN